MMAELGIGGRELMLVTGASGFLGAAIANSALQKGFKKGVHRKPGERGKPLGKSKRK